MHLEKWSYWIDKGGLKQEQPPLAPHLLRFLTRTIICLSVPFSRRAYIPQTLKLKLNITSMLVQSHSHVTLTWYKRRNTIKSWKLQCWFCNLNLVRIPTLFKPPSTFPGESLVYLQGSYQAT